MSRGLGKLQRTIVRMLADARDHLGRAEYDGEMQLAEIKAALWGRADRYALSWIGGRCRVTEAKGAGRLLATRSQATQAKQAIDALETRGLVQWLRWAAGGRAYWLVKLTPVGKSLAAETRDSARWPAPGLVTPPEETP